MLICHDKQSIYRIICILTDKYNHSLTEKHGILEMRALSLVQFTKKMLIIPTSAKQAQTSNMLYCIKAYLVLLFQCYPKTSPMCMKFAYEINTNQHNKHVKEANRSLQHTFSVRHTEKFKQAKANRLYAIYFSKSRNIKTYQKIF